MTFEEQALVNPKSTVTFAGNDYTIIEPCKRDCTIWFTRGARIATKYGIVAIGGEENKINTIACIEAVPEMLDYVYDFFKIGLKARDRINSEFDFGELMRAYTAIVERVSAPFFIGVKTKEEIKQTE
jgi:hypothetical protein